MTTNKGGKPAVQTPENATPEERAVAGLQYSLDRAANFVADHPKTSMAARSARCARAGVPIETPMKALAAIQAAAADLEKAIHAAYAAPKAPVQAAQRVQL